MAALIERTYRLGRLKGDQRQRLYRSLNARSWRTREPGEDDVPPEFPQLAKTIGETLRGAGLSESEIATISGYRDAGQDNWFVAHRRTLRAL